MSSSKNTKKHTTKHIMKQLKKDLFKWLCIKDATNCQPDRHLLRKKALELSRTRRIYDFKCTDKWLTYFLKSHGLPSELTSAGPSFDNHRSWIDLMRSIITQYKHNDLFHADELTMYSDFIPVKSTANDVLIRDEVRSPKNKISVLMCCNSSGTTKLPLLICGPYPSNISKKDHVYCHSKNCGIGDELFANWLSKFDKQLENDNRRILLLLRRKRMRALKNVTLKNVKLLFFPEEFPPLLRPLRRDIFHYVKMIYRRRYVEHLKQYSRSWTLEEILATLISSWNKVPREVIISSFQRCHFRTDESILHIDCESWEKLNTGGISFRRYVTFDDNLSDEKKNVDGRPKESQYREKKRLQIIHNYNLRKLARDVMEVDVQSTNSIVVPRTKNMEIMLEEQSSLRINEKPSAEATSAKTRSVAVKSNDNIESRQVSCKDSIGLRKSRGETNINQGWSRKQNILLSNDPAASTSIQAHLPEEKRFRNQATITLGFIDLIQPIIDEALTSTSTSKTNDARKLVDNIYASHEEANQNADNQKFNPTSEKECLSITEYSENDDCAINQPSTSLDIEVDRGSNIPSTSVDSEPIFQDAVRSSFRKMEKGDGTSIKGSPNVFKPTIRSIKILDSIRERNTNRLPASSRADQLPDAPMDEDCIIVLNNITQDTRSLSIETKDEAETVSERNINSSSNLSLVHREDLKSAKRRRSPNVVGSGDDPADGEPVEKRSKMDYNWSKEYEGKFVFGAPSCPTPSSAENSNIQNDDNVNESCQKYSK